MGFQTLANLVTTRFKEVADANGYTVRYDDDPRGTPSSGLWMKVSVDFGDNNQKEIGIHSFREVGNLTVMIRNGSGLGMKDLLIAADVVATAFRAATVNSSVLFRTPRIVKVGRVKDDNQIDVICPFQYDYSS